MEIKEVEAFLALADELHFARAAQRLGMSPGRLSQLIQALERRIGGKLAWRTSRSVRLTDLGERFHKDVKAGYDLLQDAIASAQAEADRDEATLRLGISKLAGIRYARSSGAGCFISPRRPIRRPCHGHAWSPCR